MSSIPRSGDDWHPTIPRSSDDRHATIPRSSDRQGLGRWLDQAACRVINAGEQRYRANLQRAIDDVCASGGIVYLPPLDGANEGYVVPDPPLRIHRSGVMLVGSCPQSRLLLPPKGDWTLIEIDAQAVDDAGVVLQGFWADLSGSAAPHRPADFQPLRDLRRSAHIPRPGGLGSSPDENDDIVGIRFTPENTASVLRRDSTPENAAAVLHSNPALTGTIGIRVASGNTAPVLLRDLRVGPPSGAASPNVATGISIEASAARARIEGVFVRGCPTFGLHIDSHSIASPSRVEVSDSAFFGCGRGVVASDTGFLAIRHTGFESNEHEAIDVRRVRHVVVDGCRLEANNAGGNPDVGGSAQIDIRRGCALATVQGCYVAGNDRVPVGVRVASEGRTTLCWNTIDGHTSLFDVHVAREAGALFPRPDGVRLPLNTKYVGNDVGRPAVYDDRRL